MANAAVRLYNLLYSVITKINMADPLFAACRNGDLARVKERIAEGVDVNKRTPLGHTPLHLAAHHPEIIQRLIASGAKVNVRADSGITPLHLGVCQTQVEGTVELLLRNGADVNAKDDKGITPLYVACCFGDEAMVARLLAAGACIHAKNASGKTPVSAAAKNKAVTALLLKEGGRCGCPVE